MNRRKKLIQTAEFARLCNVSKQTLIHYDRLGVFKPYYVDNKGYRFYAFEQYEIFTIINMLRELDIPLSEIKGYLQAKNPEVFLGLLEKNQNEIYLRIEQLKKLSILIDEKRMNILEGLDISDDTGISIEAHPEELIIRSDYITKHEEGGFVKAVSDIERFVSERGGQLLQYGAIVEKRNLIKGSLDLSYVYAKVSGINENTKTKPQGMYATIYHKGPFDLMDKTYGKLLSYLEDNGFLVIGDSYELSLLDMLTQENEHDYLLKISVLVEKAI